MYMYLNLMLATCSKKSWDKGNKRLGKFWKTLCGSFQQQNRLMVTSNSIIFFTTLLF